MIILQKIIFKSISYHSPQALDFVKFIRQSVKMDDDIPPNHVVGNYSKDGFDEISKNYYLNYYL